MRGRTGPVTEISVFATDISLTGMKIFPYEHSSPVTGTKLFKQNSVALTTYRPKWHNFGLLCISSLGVCELALLVKLQDSTKLWQSRTIQIYVPPFWLCFLNSLRWTGLKFPIWTHHIIRPGNRASPVTGLIWRGPKYTHLHGQSVSDRTGGYSFCTRDRTGSIFIFINAHLCCAQ